MSGAIDSKSDAQYMRLSGICVGICVGTSYMRLSDTADKKNNLGVSSVGSIPH